MIMKSLCPSEEFLADYIEGRLPERKRLQLEVHLVDCETCIQELIVSHHLIIGEPQAGIEDVPSGVTAAVVSRLKSLPSATSSSLRQKFHELLDHFHEMASEFLSLFRGGGRHLILLRGFQKTVSKDSIRRTKSFKDLKIELEVERTGKRNACIRIRLLNNIEELKGIRITLRQDKDREVASKLFDGYQVIFEDTPFGRYSLVFSRDGQKIGTYRFVTRETRDE